MSLRRASNSEEEKSGDNSPLNAVLSEKGQVTIAKPVREKLGLLPGAVLEFAAKWKTRRAEESSSLRVQKMARPG